MLILYLLQILIRYLLALTRGIEELILISLPIVVSGNVFYFLQLIFSKTDATFSAAVSSIVPRCSEGQWVDPSNALTLDGTHPDTSYHGSPSPGCSGRIAVDVVARKQDHRVSFVSLCQLFHLLMIVDCHLVLRVRRSGQVFDSSQTSLPLDFRARRISLDGRRRFIYPTTSSL